METYSPEFAKHVTGSIHPRVEDNPEQRIDLTCGKCGEQTRWYCNTGAVRLRIRQFAKSHIHQDPMTR